MFGRKSNQIKALQQQLEIKDWTLADRHQIITMKNQELESLKGEREALKARVEELQSQLAKPSQPTELAKPAEENF